MLYVVAAHLYLVFGVVLIVVIIPHVVRQRRAPSGTIAWLLIIILIPYLGVPLYWALGGRKSRRLAGRKHAVALASSTTPLATNSAVEQLTRSYGIPPAAGGHAFHLCESGEEAYQKLIDQIESARRSLHIGMFILHPDAVGTEVLKRLARRAAKGIQVRLLLDAVGSMHTSRRFLEPLTAAGGRIAYFMPVIHRPLRGRTNLRNHRKIVVADATRAIAGGMNIAEEYMGPTPLATRWRDLAFVVQGPAVVTYDQIFRADWEFASGEKLPQADPAAPPAVAGDAVLQVIPSGPDVLGDPLYHAIIQAIYAAKRRFWVVTPYFVPDESLAQALVLAARRGIDIRVIVPNRSNHPLTDMVRGQYLRDLEAAGGRILRFMPGMVHAKLIIADDDLAMIGSANMDLRSLFLDYEVMLLAYSPAVVATAGAWAERLIAASENGTPPVTPMRDFAEGLARLAAPLL